MLNDSQTLFDRIGGARAVDEMVDAFYGRVLSDPELRPFFENTEVEKLVRIQKEFFASALEGPTTKSAPDLMAIHQGMSIQRRHVTLFVNHLIAVLDESHELSRRDAMDIVFRVATYSDQVIGETSGTDG